MNGAIWSWRIKQKCRQIDFVSHQQIVQFSISIYEIIIKFYVWFIQVLLFRRTYGIMTIIVQYWVAS
jgi:hypothetical protein